MNLYKNKNISMKLLGCKLTVQIYYKTVSAKQLLQNKMMGDWWRWLVVMTMIQAHSQHEFVGGGTVSHILT